jgi:phage terminase small subunit
LRYVIQGNKAKQGQRDREVGRKGEDRRPILETLGITPVSYCPERLVSYLCFRVWGVNSVYLHYKLLNMRIKSNKSKELSGTIQDSKVKNIQTSKVGEPLLKLSTLEKDIYSSLKKHLEVNRASLEIDSIYLTIASRVINQVLVNSEELSKAGSVMIYPNGTKQISAEATAFRQSFEAFKEISKVLGLDPKSRQNMDYFVNSENEEEEDIFKQFLSPN